MIWILAALLLPLHFTAPADTLGADGAGRARVSRDPVRSYVFLRLDDRGALAPLAGYADSGGKSLLQPHRPGTRETVWLAPGEGGRGGTIYVLSIDRSGNLSAPSNACALGPAPPARPAAFPPAGTTALDVPIVMRARERCGQGALERVLRFYVAGPGALRDGVGAYEPALRGSPMSDLAGAARRAGDRADATTLAPEALVVRGRGRE